MDIKLRARLSAYSKVATVSDNNSSSNPSIPFPDVIAAGSVLGVNDNGKYTLYPKINTNDIDTLFTTLDEPDTVDKVDIDGLFENIDKPNTVDKTDIDTLFEEDKKPVSVDKTDIDGLFENNSNTDTIRSVTFAEIDSLFD